MTEHADFVRTLAAAAAYRSLSVIVHLRDGRQVDVGGLAPADAVDALTAIGVTLDEIICTEWRLTPQPRVQ